MSPRRPTGHTSSPVNTPKLTAVSLFAGCGGSDLGLKAAGIQTVWANEIHEPACKLYERIVKPGVVQCGDIRDFKEFPDADVLAGCYPCQGYSQGGRRNNKDKINYLYREFDRALRHIRPKGFIVENVDGMRYTHNKDLFNNQITRFRMAGYRVAHKLLEAKDYGLPQDRKRVLIVGIRSDLGATFEFPIPTHGPNSKGKKPYKTLRDTIWKYKDNVPEGSFCAEPLHWYYLSRNRRRDWDQQSPCIVAHWRHTGLHPDSPSLEKVGPDQWQFCEPGNARRFSYLECAAIQGFPNPKKFNFGHVRERFRAIGNAVPPPLFAAVARQLKKKLRT